jgi:hypothetical protein
MNREGQFICLHDGQPHRFVYAGLKWVIDSPESIPEKPNAAEWMCVRENKEGNQCGVTIIRSHQDVMRDKV